MPFLAKKSILNQPAIRRIFPSGHAYQYDCLVSIRHLFTCCLGSDYISKEREARKKKLKKEKKQTVKREDRKRTKGQKREKNEDEDVTIYYNNLGVFFFLVHPFNFYACLFLFTVFPQLTCTRDYFFKAYLLVARYSTVRVKQGRAQFLWIHHTLSIFLVGGGVSLEGASSETSLKDPASSGSLCSSISSAIGTMNYATDSPTNTLLSMLIAMYNTVCYIDPLP